jgi:hypothetical protein
MTSTPGYYDIGAFVVSSQPEELHQCHHYGSYHFPSGRVVYIVEHSSAQFNQSVLLYHLLPILHHLIRVSEAVAQYGFATTTVLNSPVTAASQIRRTLDFMLQQNKPVYIEVSMAVAGQLMSTQSQPLSSQGQASLQSCGPASYASSSYSQGTTLALSARASQSEHTTNGTSPEDEENSAKAGTCWLCESCLYSD